MALLKDAAKRPRVRPGRRETLHQCLDLQNLAFNAALCYRPIVEHAQTKILDSRIASAIASLVKAWDLTQDRKRILRGRPLPGSLKPEPIKRAKRKHTDLSPVESLPEKESLSRPDPSPPPQGADPMNQTFENTGGI